MKQIKIINGTYGFRPSPSVVELKNSRDPAFSVDDAEADRLVAMGVASFAGADTDPATVAEFTDPDDLEDPNGADGDTEDPEGGDTEDPGADPVPLVYNEDMKLDELKDVARNVGATEDELDALRYKKDVIALIDQIIAEAGTGSEDPEGGPEVGAADPV